MRKFRQMGWTGLVAGFLILMAMPGVARASRTLAQVPVKVSRGITFYGFVKFRASYSDKMVPGAYQDYLRIPHDKTTAGENGKFQFSSRETRFGVKAVGDSFSGWTTGGRMEFDMFGGGSNHHGEVPEMTIGEIYLTKNNTKITLGKGWAMFGTRHNPMVENYYNIVGDGFRRGLRIDVAQKFPHGNTTFGAEAMVMTYDNLLDFNTENLGFPYTSLELSMTSKTLGFAGGKPLGLWLQGLYGNMAEPDDIYQDGVKIGKGEDYDVYGVELDYYVPLLSSDNPAKKAGTLALSGKIYTGQSLGNAANLTLNYNLVVLKKEERNTYEIWDKVKGHGGWAGLTYYPSNKVWLDFYGGYDEINDKSYYPSAGVKRAYSLTANIFWQPARSILFCAEYTHAKNDFIGTDAYGTGDTDLNTIVFATYYFF